MTEADVEVLPQRLSAPLHALARGLHRREGTVVLLETLGSPGPSLLAWDPALSLRVEGRDLQLSDPLGLAGSGGSGDGRSAPARLEELLRRFRTRHPALDLNETPLPFQGGFLGFVGYEWAAGQEGPSNPTEPGVPDLWFGLFDRVLLLTPDGRARLLVVPSIRGARASEVRGALAAAERGASAPPTVGGRARPRVISDLSRQGFEDSVQDVRRRIRRGDVYQVNIAQRRRAAPVDPWGFYEQLRALNPSPYAGVLATNDLTIVSGSPELLLRAGPGSDGGTFLSTRPIAGTRPRGIGRRDELNERALRASVKEVAEHTMLVDLARNDLGRVTATGSVEVDEWLTVERYSHVMHLVSDVRGRMRRDARPSSIFQALMPGASITGTPKIRATEVIAEVEPVPRGAYTGALGALSLDGQMQFNLLIRSAIFPHGGHEAHIYAGAGIVQDSRPEREWQEVQSKAAAMLHASAVFRRRGFPWAPPRRAASWSPPRPLRTFGGRRVLLIDNYDSFTYNLAQYLGMLGAHVRVVRNDKGTLPALRSWRPTHVVLSPGPGVPADSGLTMAAVREFEGTPMLGVCLGHQAIIESYGGVVGLARRPLHGKTSWIRRSGVRSGVDLLEGLPLSFQGARYHSLVARRIPRELQVTARSLDGETMAVRHRALPTFGVQFHPESMRTPGGMSILERFLAVEAKRGGK